MTLKTQQRCKSNNGLAYFKSGTGDPILLIHGVGLRAEAWLHQAPALSKNHAVYAVDMPGHGESELLSEDSSLQDYTDTIATWIESEIKQPVIIIGHSMGSMIALDFATRYQHLCHGVAALNAVYRRSKSAKQAVQQRAQDMIKNPDQDRVSTPIFRWFNQASQGFEKEMADLCSQWLSIAPAIGYARAYRIFSQNDGPANEALTRLSVPATFITGADDANSSGLMSQQMANLCQNGSYAVIDNARHMVQLTHPNEINSLLIEFVTQCGTQMRKQL